MTEFRLTDNSVLGLMSSLSINKLLDSNYLHPSKEMNIIKAEIFIIVDNVEEYSTRTKSLKIPVLKNLENMDWGHRVIYLQDPDNYVIAFAEVIKK